MKKIYLTLAAACLLAQSPISLLQAQTTDGDPVLESIRTEIERSMKELRTGDNAPVPYYIDSRMADTRALYIKANRGQLVASRENSFREATPMLLVGGYDNCNRLGATYPIRVPFGTNDPVIRIPLWRTMDQIYKNVVQEYGRKQAELKQIKLEEEEKDIPDFQKVQPSKITLSPLPLVYDKQKLEEYIRKASEVFASYPELDDSNVYLNALNTYTRYCNSEGTECCYPSNLVVLSIYTYALGADGQEIQISKNTPYASLDELPSLADLQNLCKAQAEQMKLQLAAPLIKDPYIGPVLFEGEAVADLIENYMVDNRKGIIAQRKYNELELLFNKKIISRDLSLTSLSGTPTYNGKKLFGYFEVDAQGVRPAAEAVLIEDGVLKNMLTTRIPTRFFRESNGHARMGNSLAIPGVLRLSSSAATSPEEIRAKLIAMAKEEDYDYAYIVRQIGNAGGEDCYPAALYRIKVSDGSEELVRGAVIKNIGLRIFRKFLGISNQECVYDRIYRGSKVSYIAPSSILFEEMDIVKNSGITLKSSPVLKKPQ